MKTFFRVKEGALFSPLLVTLIFFGLSLYFSLSHSMWRDEMQAWLIARDSHSVFELFGNARYEGHPILWYLLLMLSKQVLAAPISMQILHVLLATAAVFILLKYSPFSNSQKLLLIFGYYPFYEYSTISRNYGMGVLLIFVYCALFKNRQKYILPIGITLFLLAQTNIFGLIISLAAIASLLAGYLLELKRGRALPSAWAFCLGLAIAILGVLCSAWEMSPPADSGFAKEWFFVWDKARFQGALAALSNAFFPLPTLQQHYWNATSWSGTFSAYVFAPLAVVACFLFAKSIKKNIPVLCFFLLALVGIELFLYVKYLGYWRHQGHLYIVFIAAIWLARDSVIGGNQHDVDPSAKKQFKVNSVVLNFILVVHLLGALIAHVGEQRFVFSSGRMAAEYLKSNQLLDNPLVAFPDFVAPSVLGYLGDKNIFYPEVNANGSYIKWNTARLQRVDQFTAIQAARNLSAKSTKDVIFLTNAPLDEALLSKEGLIPLGAFEGSINRDENYYLYVVKKVN